MGYFPVRYNSRVVIYEHKMFIRLATGFKPEGAGSKAQMNPLHIRCFAQWPILIGNRGE